MTAIIEIPKGIKAIARRIAEDDGNISTAAQAATKKARERLYSECDAAKIPRKQIDAYIRDVSETRRAVGLRI